MPTADRMFLRIRELEVEIAQDFPTVWVAGHGPRVSDLRSAMRVLHEAFQNVVSEVSRRESLARMEDRFVDLAAAALKLATDLQVVIGPNDCTMPAREDVPTLAEYEDDPD